MTAVLPLAWHACGTDANSPAGDRAVPALALRGLSPREPAVPVAHLIAQLRPLDAELSVAGGSALQARVLFAASLLCLAKVSLRCRGVQDGLLICAVRL